MNKMKANVMARVVKYIHVYIFFYIIFKHISFIYICNPKITQHNSYIYIHNIYVLLQYKNNQFKQNRTINIT